MGKKGAGISEISSTESGEVRLKEYAEEISLSQWRSGLILRLFQLFVQDASLQISRSWWRSLMQWMLPVLSLSLRTRSSYREVQSSLPPQRHLCLSPRQQLSAQAVYYNPSSPLHLFSWCLQFRQKIWIPHYYTSQPFWWAGRGSVVRLKEYAGKYGCSCE